MPPKWVPNAAEMAPDSHAVYFGFCPANSQLYRITVKRARRNAAIPCRLPSMQHSMQDRYAGLMQDLDAAFDAGLECRTWQTAIDRLIDVPRPGGWNRFLFVRRWRFS